MVSSGVSWNLAAKAEVKGHFGGEPILVGGENTCAPFPYTSIHIAHNKSGDTMTLGPGEGSFPIRFVLGLHFY